MKKIALAAGITGVVGAGLIIFLINKLKTTDTTGVTALAQG